MPYILIDDTFKACQAGMIGRAKDESTGEMVFCKRFASPVEPAPDLGEHAKKRIKKEFDEFRARKLRVNEMLRKISTPGGTVVYPIAEFVQDHHWIEVTELIDDVIPTDQYAAVIRSLTAEQKLLAIKRVINALKTLHSHKIVHADLKLDNIMLVKDGDGNVVSKIIDFDGMEKGYRFLDEETGERIWLSAEECLRRGFLREFR